MGGEWGKFVCIFDAIELKSYRGLSEQHGCLIMNTMDCILNEGKIREATMC